VNEFLSKPVSAKLLHQRIMSIRGNPRPMVQIGDYYGPEPRKVKSSAWQSSIPTSRSGSDFSTSFCA
jgi:hypothetical protein